MRTFTILHEHIWLYNVTTGAKSSTDVIKGHCHVIVCRDPYLLHLEVELSQNQAQSMNLNQLILEQETNSSHMQFVEAVSRV